MPDSESPDSTSTDAASQELRQDLLTKQWVIVAPTRNHRPHEIEDESPPDLGDASPVEGCPFCPGHESMLPRILWSLSGNGHGPVDWRTRVVPNKYPALTMDPSPRSERCGLYRLQAGIGQQEVVIDTPYHYESLAHMPVDQVEAVVHTYLERYRALREDDLFPVVFRNHGTDAGASLPHPHSQIIAPNLAPPRIQQEEQQAEAQYAETGRCPYCEMMDEELDAGVRLVHTNEDFVTFVPYAAQVPCEMWILPREHEPEFGRVDSSLRSSLADALHTAIHALHMQSGDPAYNFFVRTALEPGSTAPHLHWSLRIRPRTTVDAGFELGTGMKVNPSLPERDARRLRGEDGLPR